MDNIVELMHAIENEWRRIKEDKGLYDSDYNTGYIRGLQKAQMIASDYMDRKIEEVCEDAVSEEAIAEIRF